MRRPSSGAVATFVAVAGTVGFVFWQLDPSLLFSNTTPAGGDMGAHVALPAYLRDHLLPHGRLTGWSPEWYDGYPALTYYFPLPSLAVVILNVALPYNIAFKLVSVAGLLSLPVAAWAFGRLMGLRRPAPACLAVATLPFLFDQSFTIYGGNIASTLAGEFAFSIALSIGLVFLGVMARGLTTGRHRALAASLFALTLLCHLIPALFVAVGAVVLVLMRARWKALSRYGLPVATVGLALTGFWAVPFVLRHGYTTNMGWQNVTTYVHSLFPGTERWVLVLAVIGLVLSVLRRNRTGVFLGVMAGLSAAAFVLDPQSALYNARLLPFWVLCCYLEAGIGVAEAAALVARGWQRLGGRQPAEPGGLATPVVAVLAACAFVALPLVSLPSWFPVKVTSSFVPSWVRWNYSGYEGKASYPEYHAVVATMARLGRRYGCGRAMWEYEPQLDRLGTPMALMLLPYWTGGCIDSEEGLFFESSTTTPWHFLDQSELSDDPSRAMVGLPYGPLDVARGVKHLQLLGVRYYMALSPDAEAQANQDPDLKLLARSGPWPVNYSGQVLQRTWNIYLVKASDEVTPLTYEPAVLSGLASGSKPWLSAVLPWYEDPSRWPVLLSDGGPAGWPRVAAGTASLPRRAVAPTTVSRIHTSDDRIDFDVSRVGSPVLVKASYFPNWQAQGALGPWRVSPNLMVVVPTSRHVSLHYGETPVDLAGWLLTLAGLGGLVWLWRRGPADLAANAGSSSGRSSTHEEGEGTAVAAHVEGAVKADLVVTGAPDPDKTSAFRPK
jgi:6-pyruvoyl-tetrahydropterin synthase related domain